MGKKSLKEILEYYANSTLGDLQADGTYKFYYATNDLGMQCITYDPRPAKEGLEILKKMERIIKCQEDTIKGQEVMIDRFFNPDWEDEEE